MKNTHQIILNKVKKMSEVSDFHPLFESEIIASIKGTEGLDPDDILKGLQELNKNGQIKKLTGPHLRENAYALTHIRQFQ